MKYLKVVPCFDAEPIQIRGSVFRSKTIEVNELTVTSEQ